jgi:hypothetical protein
MRFFYKFRMDIKKGGGHQYGGLRSYQIMSNQALFDCDQHCPNCNTVVV